MTDLRKAAQMALDWRDKNSELLFELGGWDFIFEINDWSQSIRGALAQPEQEPVATLFGSLPVYDVPPKQEPVAWVENLENARPHCVTDLKYCSVAQHERGEHLKYIPLYTAPPQREWQGLTDEEILEEYRQSYGDDGNLTDIYFAHAIQAKLKDKNHAV